MNMKSYLLGLMLILYSSSTFGQVQKFGKIDKREVEQIDPDIPAEVIFDHGKLELGDQFIYKLKRHKRIKIHTSQGLEYATFNLAFNAGEEQAIEKLEAITYVLNRKGKLEKHKLNVKKDVFEQDLTAGWKKLAFTMPEVKEGAVIEIRYVYKIGGPFSLPNWEFDDYIPVRWSEMEAIIPVRQEFSLVSRLSKDFHISTVDEKTVYIYFDHTPELGHETSQKRVRRMKSPAQHYRWVMRDLPATRIEPQISSISNYREKIFFQFSAFNAPGRSSREYAESWEDVSEFLSEDEKFGLQLDKDRWSQTLIEELFSEEDSRESKIEKIYDYVNSFRWNEREDFYIQSSLEEVNRNKAGNSVELNLLAVKLLKQAGFSAYPVLTSTRSNGKISKEFVLLSQFNYVVALVEHNGRDMIMDVLDGHGGALVPTYLLNGEGLVINRYTPRWVNLEKQTSSNTIVKYELEMTDDTLINGHAELTSVGYDAMTLYDQFEALGQEKFTQTYTLGGVGNARGRCHVKEAPSFFDSNLKLSTDFTLALDKGSTGLLYIEPVTNRLIQENPFKEEDRQLPIEFPYTFTRTTQIDIKIPEGYSLEQLPQTKSIRLSRKAISYVESYSQSENTVTITRRVVVGRKMYQASDYFAIKRIFEIANAESTERLILKKS